MSTPRRPRQPTEALPEPTGAELEVMKVIWRGGRQSAREIHELLPEGLGWAYSTTRTTLDRMVRKGLATRSAFHGLYLYEACISRPQGLASAVRRFAERVLEVPPAAVVSLFSESEALSREEIAELRELIESESTDDP